MPHAGRRLVTINAATELADVSRRTIYNWMRAGRLEFVRTPGGKVRIYVDTLLPADVLRVERDTPTRDEVERMIDAAFERFLESLDRRIIRALGLAARPSVAVRAGALAPFPSGPLIPPAERQPAGTAR